MTNTRKYNESSVILTFVETKFKNSETVLLQGAEKKTGKKEIREMYWVPTE